MKKIKKLRFCCFFCLFMLFFTNSVFSEQYEFLEEYKSNQTTETAVVLPSDETVIISTKGAFDNYNAVSLNPEYIKIKEQKAGTLKKGDCIYFEINKGTFLKDIAVTTQGDINAVASAKGAYIKLEITETSTEPSEITLSRIMILSEGENKSSSEIKEYCLSAKYISGALTKEFILNPYFAAMKWDSKRDLCYSEFEGYRFEGRLSFTEGTSFCILNDNIIPTYYDTYMKQNYLMVPLRSLYHVAMVNDHYCNTYSFNSYISNYYPLYWDIEQKKAIINFNTFHNASFQNNSNIVIITKEYDGDKRGIHQQIINMPVSAEIKNNILYVPFCSQTLKAILQNNIQCNTYWNNKTMTLEI